MKFNSLVLLAALGYIITTYSSDFNSTDLNRSVSISISGSSTPRCWSDSDENTSSATQPGIDPEFLLYQTTIIHALEHNDALTLHTLVADPRVYQLSQADQNALSTYITSAEAGKVADIEATYTQLATNYNYQDWVQFHAKVTELIELGHYPQLTVFQELARQHIVRFYANQTVNVLLNSYINGSQEGLDDLSHKIQHMYNRVQMAEKELMQPYVFSLPQETLEELLKLFSARKDQLRNEIHFAKTDIGNRSVKKVVWTNVRRIKKLLRECLDVKNNLNAPLSEETIKLYQQFEKFQASRYHAAPKPGDDPAAGVGLGPW